MTRYRPGEQIEARRTLELPKSGAIILSCGAMRPRLNIHLIVEAFYAVAAQHRDAWTRDVSRPAIIAAINDVVRNGDISKNGVFFDGCFKKSATERKPGCRPMPFPFIAVYALFRVRRRLNSVKL